MRIIDQIRNRESFTPTENTLAKYLEENSLMKRAYRAAKGIKELIP